MAESHFPMKGSISPTQTSDSGTDEHDRELPVAVTEIDVDARARYFVRRGSDILKLKHFLETSLIVRNIPIIARSKTLEAVDNMKRSSMLQI